MTEIIKHTKIWWDYKFLSLTKDISSFSKDPSTKVGAIIINPKRRIMSTGYNGLPADIPDSIEILHDRDKKIPLINHAEKNAFDYAEEYGLDVSDCTIFTWPFLPCVDCYDIIKKHKISRIVAPKNNNPRWLHHFNQVRVLCKKDNIELLELSPIDDLIDEWHEMINYDLPFHEFIGFSWQEYKDWVECKGDKI